MAMDLPSHSPPLQRNVTFTQGVVLRSQAIDAIGQALACAYSAGAWLPSDIALNLARLDHVENCPDLSGPD